jgi:hypothetical protein
VVEALRNAGAEVDVHDDVFPQSTTDVEWLGEAGQRGWVVLTKDATIRRNPPERRAVEAANVRMFVLTQQSLSGPEMATLFASALAGMRKRCAGTPPPFIFSIARNGSFSRLV